MAYGNARARQQSEILQLQNEIFQEVQGDTEHLAGAIFGSVDNQPDLGRVSNERLDQVYRQAYQRGDREFLQREARRDPEQFLKTAQRIGVQVAPPPPALPALPAMPQMPAQPMPMPMPMQQAMPAPMPGMPPAA